MIYTPNKHIPILSAKRDARTGVIYLSIKFEKESEDLLLDYFLARVYTLAQSSARVKTLAQDSMVRSPVLDLPILRAYRDEASGCIVLEIKHSRKPKYEVITVETFLLLVYRAVAEPIE